jgi:hypothetical protein
MKIKLHSVFASLMVAMLINGSVIANEKVRASGGETVKLEAGQEDTFPVTVDLIVDEVSDISIAGGRARAVAELLLSWRDEAMHVSKARTLMGGAIDTFLAKNFDPGVFVVNSEAPREVITRSLTLFPDGRVELHEKFAVTLTIETAIPSYPFGDLDLHIELQSANHALPELTFVPRHFEFGHDDLAHTVVKGNWYLNGSSSEVINVKSLSHGGKSRFAVAMFHIKVAHNFLDIAQKILIPLLSILLLSLFINKYSVIYETESGGDNGNWRVGGQLTLLLTLFALKFSLGDDIPATHYLTMIDALFVAVGIMVVFALMWSIYTIYLFQSGRVELGYKFEHKSNVVFVVVALFFLVWILSFIFRTGH